MQGSGTFAVESVMTSTISNDDKVLIISNGAYGERIVKMAQYIGLQLLRYSVPYNEYPNEEEIRKYFKRRFGHYPSRYGAL